jgi:poly-beta-1,6-N-acetyl-D-glucosamine N-deacetylase
MRADLFNRVSWQLNTRTGVQVFAWMPATSFAFNITNAVTTQASNQERGKNDTAWENHSSTFDEASQNSIKKIYEDLGKSSVFAGIYFRDANDRASSEDQTKSALLIDEKVGQSTEYRSIRSDDKLKEIGSANEAIGITGFTLVLSRILKKYQPALLTARNLPASPVLSESGLNGDSRSYSRYLDTYDYTVVLTQLNPSRLSDSNQGLKSLVVAARDHPKGLRHTIFEVQSKDWKTRKNLEEKVLDSRFRVLRSNGARNIGYYPDDFINDHPKIRVIKKSFSLSSQPIVK